MSYDSAASAGAQTVQRTFGEQGTLSGQLADVVRWGSISRELQDTDIAGGVSLANFDVLYLLAIEGQAYRGDTWIALDGKQYELTSQVETAQRDQVAFRIQRKR